MGPIIPVSARDQSVESFKAFPIHLSKVCIDKKKAVWQLVAVSHSFTAMRKTLLFG